MDTYTVTINGRAVTMQLDEAAAKRMGAQLVEQVQTDAAKAKKTDVANKARRGTATKSAAE